MGIIHILYRILRDMGQVSPDGMEASLLIPSAMTSLRTLPFSSERTCGGRKLLKKGISLHSASEYLVKSVSFDVKPNTFQYLGHISFAGGVVSSESSQQIGGHVTHFWEKRRQAIRVNFNFYTLFLKNIIMIGGMD